jgi:hypothetical protein
MLKRILALAAMMALATASQAAIIITFNSPANNSVIPLSTNSVTVNFTVFNAVAGLSTVTAQGERGGFTSYGPFAPNTNSITRSFTYTLPGDRVAGEVLTVEVNASGIVDDPVFQTLDIQIQAASTPTPTPSPTPTPTPTPTPSPAPTPTPLAADSWSMYE